MVLGYPEEQTPLTITDAVTTITIQQGLIALEIQNTGNNPVAYGKASTLTYARGKLIYEQGDSKTWENVPSGWVISFRCDTAKTTTLRLVYYK